MNPGHKYITVSGYKPAPSEIEVAELAINLVDGTIWTKRPDGVIIQLGV